MKQLMILAATLILNLASIAQEPDNKEWTKVYRETVPLINDLVHTKADVKFDYDKSYLYGKAWLTLKPHFYPTDSLKLDAKGMDIKTVALVKGSSNQPLKYDYDGMILKITLDKIYTRNDKYTVFIDYVSKPNDLKTKGSAAITDAKGLYFINPKGTDPNKPTQIWTQGETEATSVWIPIIDKPNQKTTQELSMTVPSKYVTLSNGKLTSQKNNSNGTRTDTWKMDLPHAPYLFFMGVGDFAIVKDQYKGKEVSYYVEKEYAPVARQIFGHTPEMIAFYAKALGVEYPWVKYSQIVGRDYVSGAMENTTATLHQQSAQQDARELKDGNIWENTIAHELFHQWFGDYVTTESWSNLTLNESFANYSEYLWQEHKYGKDAADDHNFAEMNGYLQSMSDKKDLVRFYYEDKEAMFDAVSYNKGGRILHMLRNYVGDSAFFKALHLYLTENKFSTAEAHQLRIAFEKTTGLDLNWFWNQWYYGSGHPKLDINYVYDDAAKKVKVVVSQKTDKIFRLPIAVDIYNGSKKVRHKVWLSNKTDTLDFEYASHPDLVNVDADKMLLVEKTDNKTLDNFIHQYKYAGNYLDRKEAIDFAAESADPKAVALVKTALKDKYDGIRAYALGKLDLKNEQLTNEVEPIIADLAANDPKPKVKASALGILAMYGDDKYKNVFEKNLNDSSYSVAGAALEGLMEIDSAAAISKAKTLAKGKMKGRLLENVTAILMASGDESGFDMIASTFESMPVSQSKFNLIQPLSVFIVKTKDTEKVKKGIDLIVQFRDAFPPNHGIVPYLNNLMNNIAKKKQESADSSAKEQVTYIQEKISK
ncbi:MAG: M1 family peptidase [Chitinophagaceae bacterium]|nr:M1 family peptidase [Chitinophagaceae bacterium]